MQSKTFKAKLESMEAALVKMFDVLLDQLDPRLKIWASVVRYMSYVIEDSLDSYIASIESSEPFKTHTFKGFLEETHNKMTRCSP